MGRSKKRGPVNAYMRVGVLLLFLCVITTFATFYVLRGREQFFVALSVDVPIGIAGSLFSMYGGRVARCAAPDPESQEERAARVSIRLGMVFTAIGMIVAVAALDLMRGRGQVLVMLFGTMPLAIAANYFYVRGRRLETLWKSQTEGKTGSTVSSRKK